MCIPFSSAPTPFTLVKGVKDLRLFQQPVLPAVPAVVSLGWTDYDDSKSQSTQLYCFKIPLQPLKKEGFPNPLPNGAFIFSSISDVGMRVGADYQARIPDFDPGKYIYLFFHFMT